MQHEPTKFCPACRSTKPITAYYKSRKRICADCVKAQARAYREANLERVRAYDRTRGQMESRKARVRARYHADVASPDRRAKHWERSAKWRAANALKRKAQIILGNAVRDGRVERPSACSSCDRRCVPHGHHEDYTKPLNVTWLCKPCHGKRHREINEMKRAGVDLSAKGF